MARTDNISDSVTKNSSLAETAVKLSDMRDENITNLVTEELLLQWIAGIVIFLFAAALFFFFFSLISRAMKNKKQAKVDVLNEKYRLFLSEIVSGTDNAMKAELGVSADSTLSLDLSDINGRLSRAVLKENLLELYRHISGQEKEAIRNIYLMLGYAKEAIHALKNGNVPKRIQAIDELSMLDVKDTHKEVFKMVNDKSEAVRDVAIAARARRDEHPLSLLEDLQNPFSKWQQSVVYNALVKYHADHIPSFKKYVISSNQDIAYFSMRLASLFQQAECAVPISKRLDDDSKEVRLEAARSLSAYPSGEFKELLQEQLDNTNDVQEKCVLLKAMRDMIDGTDTDWLLDLVIKGDRDVVIESANMLAGIGKIDELSNVINNTNEPWLKHATDKSIHAL